LLKAFQKRSTDDLLISFPIKEIEGRNSVRVRDGQEFWGLFMVNNHYTRCRIEQEKRGTILGDIGQYGPDGIAFMRRQPPHYFISLIF
jgi:hypothetical protein